MTGRPLTSFPRRIVMRTLLLTLVLTATPAGAFAQSPVQVQFGPSTPSMEFGAHLGLWSLVGDDGLVGGRFGKRITEWLVAEGTFDKSTHSNANREHRLLLASVRLQPPDVPDERRLF